MAVPMGGSQAILDWFKAAGVIIPAQTRRITLDLHCDRPARIYFDCFADTDLFSLPALDLTNVEMWKCGKDATEISETSNG